VSRRRVSRSATPSAPNKTASSSFDLPVRNSSASGIGTSSDASGSGGCADATTYAAPPSRSQRATSATNLPRKAEPIDHSTPASPEGTNRLTSPSPKFREVSRRWLAVHHLAQTQCLEAALPSLRSHHSRRVATSRQFHLLAAQLELARRVVRSCVQVRVRRDVPEVRHHGQAGRGQRPCCWQPGTVSNSPPVQLYRLRGMARQSKARQSPRRADRIPSLLGRGVDPELVCASPPVPLFESLRQCGWRSGGKAQHRSAQSRSLLGRLPDDHELLNVGVTNVPLFRQQPKW